MGALEREDPLQPKSDADEEMLQPRKTNQPLNNITAHKHQMQGMKITSDIYVLLQSTN